MIQYLSKLNTRYKIVSAFVLGGIAGAWSGAGASNGKALAKSLSNGTAAGMKTLTANLTRYAKDALKTGIGLMTDIVNKNFTKSVIRIWGSTIVMPTAQYLSVKALQLLGL